MPFVATFVKILGRKITLLLHCTTLSLSGERVLTPKFSFIANSPGYNLTNMAIISAFGAFQKFW
jgi:hypothetical protein